MFLSSERRKWKRGDTTSAGKCLVSRLDGDDGRGVRGARESALALGAALRVRVRARLQHRRIHNCQDFLPYLLKLYKILKKLMNSHKAGLYDHHSLDKGVKEE